MKSLFKISRYHDAKSSLISRYQADIIISTLIFKPVTGVYFSRYEREVELQILIDLLIRIRNSGTLRKSRLEGHN